MTATIKNTIRVTGALLVLMAVFMALPIACAIYYAEKTALISFLCTALCCIAIGSVIMKFYSPSNIKMKRRDGFFIVSQIWILAAIIGAVPLYMSGSIPHFFDAFFETCSGFSTTGSTILTDIEGLPNSMLLWRSFTHWLGGMGIIVFTTALLPSMGISGQMIASQEAPGPTLDKLSPKYSDSAKKLYILYIVFTLVELVLLMLGGMNLLDATIHAFGTVGTGGFSNHSESVAYFTSPFIQWTIIIFMILCGTNFNLYFTAAKSGIKGILKDEEFRLYIIFLALCTVGIVLDLKFHGMMTTPFKTVTDALFQTSSVMTTTGYGSCDYDTWPTLSKTLILLLFITGASSSSTGGGIKVIRILVALKILRKGIGEKIHPRKVTQIKLQGKPVSDDVIFSISTFVFFYIFILFAGMLIVSLNGFDIITTFSATLTCLGNVGPGFNLVGPSMNFSIFNPFTKVVLALLMIAGRLELFTFFMLFSPHYWNTDRY